MPSEQNEGQGSERRERWLGAVERTTSPEKRREQILTNWLEAAEKENDAEAIRKVCREALAANEYVRQADDSERGWSYYPSPDHNVRLLGAKLLADVDGLTGAAAKVQLNVQDNSVHVSVSDRLMELSRINVDRNQLLSDIEAIVRVEKAAPVTEAETT